MMTIRRVTLALSGVLLLVLLGLLGPIDRAGGQGADVRIDLKTGQLARLPLRTEALRGAGSGAAPSRDADNVLAADLQNSAVFQVQKAWSRDTTAQASQLVVGGTWTVSGSQVRLQG